MKYKQRTKYFGMPVPGYDDVIWPELELQRFQIIENLLLAGTKGVRNCVFDDGLFELNPETDNTFVVTLRATGHAPSAIGMVGGAYFSAPPVISWTGLKKGYVHYLYLRGSSKTFEDCSLVKMVSSIYTLEGDNLLMAVADCRNDQPKVDPYPDSKLYADDLARHVNDMENPHGRTLVQDELFVRKTLCLFDNDGNSADVQVMVDGKPVTIPARLLPGAAMELAGRLVLTMDFDSPGMAGKILSAPEGTRVMFVQVSRRFSGELKGIVGEVAVGYFGQDSHLHLANEFSVCNSGDDGLPLRALVYCG